MSIEDLRKNYNMVTTELSGVTDELARVAKEIKALETHRTRLLNTVKALNATQTDLTLKQVTLSKKIVKMETTLKAADEARSLHQYADVCRQYLNNDITDEMLDAGEQNQLPSLSVRSLILRLSRKLTSLDFCTY